MDVAGFSAIECNERVENSINSLSPYIGKMRLSLAKHLIEQYAEKPGIIYDPFAGSGTVLLEGWALGYEVVGSDLNYYAYVLSMGKLNPYKCVEEAKTVLLKYRELAEERALTLSIDDVPMWVRDFYDPNTLREICCWFFYLKEHNEWFLLSCLLGILHHQRPGFLSYPASHGAPYLRSSKYPKDIYPEMYQYKNVYEKLLKKVERSYKHIPSLDYSLSRKMILGDATKVRFNDEHFSTIITSPPYMKSLTYARDNRLRLWFLGEENWNDLDKTISPEKNLFIQMMKICFAKWADYQHPGDKCIIVIGDISVTYNGNKTSLVDVLVDISKQYYLCKDKYQDMIPESRKVVKGNSNIKREIIVIFERK